MKYYVLLFSLFTAYIANAQDKFICQMKVTVVYYTTGLPASTTVMLYQDPPGQPEYLYSDVNGMLIYFFKYTGKFMLVHHYAEGKADTLRFSISEMDNNITRHLKFYISPTVLPKPKRFENPIGFVARPSVILGSSPMVELSMGASIKTSRRKGWLIINHNFTPAIEWNLSLRDHIVGYKFTYSYTNNIMLFAGFTVGASVVIYDDPLNIAPFLQPHFGLVLLHSLEADVLCNIPLMKSPLYDKVNHFGLAIRYNIYSSDF